jgi:hypothetical protein
MLPHTPSPLGVIFFGKQRRTRYHDIEERRNSLPLQNLYVNPAGFSRHRYARRTFWSTLVYPHVIRFSVSTFQVQQSFSDILLLLLIFFDRTDEQHPVAMMCDYYDMKKLFCI